MKKNLLIVDDEKLVRWALKNSMESSICKVHSASNGKEAMDMLDEEQFDLIITDLVMPGSSGMDVVNKAKEIQPESKVILMTAYGSLLNREDAEIDGVSDFIDKPFMLTDVKRKINKLLYDDIDQ